MPVNPSVSEDNTDLITVFTLLIKYDFDIIGKSV
jgi:hypothetical protein